MGSHLLTVFGDYKILMRTPLNVCIGACKQKWVLTRFMLAKCFVLQPLLPKLPEKSGTVFADRDNMSASWFDLEFCFVKTCLRYNGSVGAECKCEDSFIG